MSTGKRQAIVLSAGGAYAAYEVGVIQALAQGRSPTTGYRPLRPAIVTGTSAGAYNAAFLVAALASGSSRVAERLEAAWLDVIADRGDGDGNGLYRYRVDPSFYLDLWQRTGEPLLVLGSFLEDVSILTAESLRVGLWALGQRGVPLPQRAIEAIDLTAFFSTAPFTRTLLRTIDFDACCRSGIAIRLALTSWTTGRAWIATNRDLTPESGPALVRGSASLPGLFPPVRLGSELFIDGSATMYTPLGPALEAGAEVLHVIGTFPVPGYFHVTRSSIVTMVRAQLITFNALLHAQASGYRGDPPVVHHYLPRTDLSTTPFDVLNFDRDLLEGFIRRGYEDTVTHDCVANGCRGVREDAPHHRPPESKRTQHGADNEPGDVYVVYPEGHSYVGLEDP